jgi:hypothetical protein
VDIWVSPVLPTMRVRAQQRPAWGQGLWGAWGGSKYSSQPLICHFSQPTAQGAFLRGSGLSLASGRFTAPVSAIFQFSASLHVGEPGWPVCRKGEGWVSPQGWVPDTAGFGLVEGVTAVLWELTPTLPQPRQLLLGLS